MPGNSSPLTVRGKEAESKTAKTVQHHCKAGCDCLGPKNAENTKTMSKEQPQNRVVYREQSGLGIVHDIITLMGGEYQAEDTEGK